jgi:hypothetical protein
MGGHAYWYIVAYERELQAALDKLRQREFLAGRYNPVTPIIGFPITANSPSPGAQHASIYEALMASEADGTRSILDIETIGDEPDFGTACPLPDEVLQSLFGTTQPKRDAVEGNSDYLENVERGQAIYILLYDHARPSEILFAGYSFD